jgi:hypothetical protein
MRYRYDTVAILRERLWEPATEALAQLVSADELVTFPDR